MKSKVLLRTIEFYGEINDVEQSQRYIDDIAVDITKHCNQLDNCVKVRELSHLIGDLDLVLETFEDDGIMFYAGERYELYQDEGLVYLLDSDGETHYFTHEELKGKIQSSSGGDN